MQSTFRKVSNHALGRVATWCAAALLAAGTAGCATNGGAPALAARDWVLVSLGERTNPTGGGGRPLTMRFENDSTKSVAGFAGCNRYRGSYTLEGETLRLGPVMSTKMACADGNDIETAFITMLSQVEKATVADSTLTLAGASGALATLRAR